MRKSTLGMVAVLTLMLCGGCSSDGGSGIKAINDGTARDMNSARSQFETAEDPPLTAQTHFAAGQLNETQGQFLMAIDQYHAALTLDPQHIPSLFRLGLVCSQQRKYPEAMEAWNRYIAATNGGAIGYSNLAFCQELSGDVGSAEQSYLAGISRDPKSQPCRVNYGLMLARQGRLDEARTQFAEVLPPAQVHYNMASVFQQQGKKEAAKHEYAEAIKIDPKFIDAQARMVELEKN